MEMNCCSDPSYYTGSFTTSGIVLGFVVISSVTTYLLGQKFFSYYINNQNIEKICD